MTSSRKVVAIPVVELSDGGPVRHVLESGAQARALRDACIGCLPGVVTTMLPVIDALTRRWLSRSCSRYTVEINAIATELGFSGIWFLNGCYQWACTSVAREQEGTPWLARTLDWPFAGLGRHAVVAKMRGPAGAFENVTWPGYVGVLTASAPGRFAACANQAPMLRRTRHPLLRPWDAVLNTLSTAAVRFTPPDHLLREVFETCGTYGEAKHRLEETPVARPVIYTLVGCRPAERCVIERTEESFVTTDDETAAANDWLQSRSRWEARVALEGFLTRTSDEAAENSRARRDHLLNSAKTFDATFEWVSTPVLNALTRLAVEMCPAGGVLRVAGYEQIEGRELPEQVTYF
jgi:hypothetical protein